MQSHVRTAQSIRRLKIGWLCISFGIRSPPNVIFIDVSCSWVVRYRRHAICLAPCACSIQTYMQIRITKIVKQLSFMWGARVQTKIHVKHNFWQIYLSLPFRREQHAGTATGDPDQYHEREHQALNPTHTFNADMLCHVYDTVTHSNSHTAHTCAAKFSFAIVLFCSYFSMFRNCFEREFNCCDSVYYWCDCSHVPAYIIIIDIPHCHLYSHVFFSVMRLRPFCLIHSPCEFRCLSSCECSS